MQSRPETHDDTVRKIPHHQHNYPRHGHGALFNFMSPISYGAERFQIRVGLVAAEPVARDDQGAFRAGMQRAHASQVVAQKQALVEKIQARTVQDSLQKRANGVQAKSRRAGTPNKRDRICRVCRRRGRSPDAAGPKLRLEAHGQTGDRQGRVFNEIDPHVWRNVNRPARHQHSRLGKPGGAPRISRVDPPGSPETLHGARQRRLPQAKSYSKMREICRRRHRLRVSPPVHAAARPRRSRVGKGISRGGWPAGISGLQTS